MGFNPYKRPLERAAYICGTSLVRRYTRRLEGDGSSEAPDPSLIKPVRPLGRKRWLITLLVVCGVVFGVTNDAFWTIEKFLSESTVRGPMNMREFAVDTRPVTRPMSHIVWSMRGSMDFAASPALERQGLAFVSKHISPLSSQWLAALPESSDQTAPVTNPALWAFIEPAELFAGLPDLSPERLAPFSAVNGEALSEEGSPLRWNAVRQLCEVTATAQTELMSRLEAWEKQQQTYSRGLQARAERYQNAVETWSRRYDLNADLLYAIIYTESSFNPNLVSHRDAHGLMQVVPRTAGGEVKAWLGEKGTPTAEELLNPSTNIKYGAAYFRLLLKRHFPGVSDELSREYCAIAAYNAGSSQVLKLFGGTRDAAFMAINELTPEEVLNTLLTRSPSRETRGFLKKVLASRTHFVAMN